ncbi:MAG: efflux RND transporter periplasmic adaptor subunit [Desulfobacteraceae bacterium]|jgi:RND family efflux transporter MFP subunit
MRIKHPMSLIVGFVFVGVAVVLWAMPSRKPLPTNADDHLRVLLDTVEVAHTERSARFAGVTQAKNRAILSFTVPARVLERHIESGSKVARGEVLARLDDREFRNAVDLARATFSELKTQLAQAKRDRARVERLATSDVVPVAQLEKVVTRQSALESSLAAAAARLKESRRLLDEVVLTAPFSGTITKVYIQPGEWAVPGQPAIELTGDGAIELLVQVPETMLDRVSKDQRVQVELPFVGNRRVPGRISSIAKAALTAGRLFPLKVELVDEPGVVAGLTAQLIIDLSTQGVLTVPLAAVVNPGASQPYLFIYDNGTVSRHTITIGGIIGDRIVVSGNLHEGDRVVISGQSQLTDGQRVEAAS